MEATHTDLPTDVIPPIIEDLRMAVRQIKSAKAEEPDNIPAEASKSRVEAIANMIHTLFRKIWEKEKVPLTNWKEGSLIKIPKRGDLSSDRLDYEDLNI
ncbi:unnamed protein product [Schistosoma mattheei]|uniref:Uncharacterized protein n=1 Tax=Schistosoma mattheei TaxID=31246 RepID=A0A183NZB2_9TREM|nr:unnamed protein product [Schistosoma mattheei]